MCHKAEQASYCPVGLSSQDHCETCERMLYENDSMDVFFFDRYCCVIGPWFDLLDSGRNFSYAVPKHFHLHDLLRSSTLTCAVRQYWLTSGCLERNTYNYYELAPQKLDVHLNDMVYTLTAAFFASLLLVAHCEMIDASYQD